jgi:hypothetical protein
MSGDQAYRHSEEERNIDKNHQDIVKESIKSAFQNRCLWCADRYEHTRTRAIFTENRTHLACDATPPTRF